MHVKTVGKTLAARMHCVMENVQTMKTRMIVITFAIEASSPHGFNLPGVDIVDVSETNVPLSMPAANEWKTRRRANPSGNVCEPINSFWTPRERT